MKSRFEAASKDNSEMAYLGGDFCVVIPTLTPIDSQNGEVYGVLMYSFHFKKKLSAR